MTGPLGSWSQRPSGLATIAVLEGLEEWGEVLAYAELGVYRGRPALRDAELLRLGYRRTGPWEPDRNGEWICPVEQLRTAQPSTPAASTNSPAGGTEP